MLEELAKKYGTDKLEHGYIPYYEKYLPKEPESLLEFGVYKGASVRMWKEYFPNAKIAAFDLFKEFDIEKELQDEGIKTYRGDVFYNKDLNKIDESYDVIIEDSSHNSIDQLKVFFHAFFFKLNPGGVYVVEDLHCCKDSFYWSHGIKSIESTLLGYLRDWIKDTEPIPEEQKIIKEIKLFDDKIAFIFKK